MNNLVILTGPTAVGKTKLSIQLAREIGGEIISADCMQVYKYMDIGTAKITQEEMQGIKHHLIDVIFPDESFDVYKFKEMATSAITDIQNRGHIPIICGGTGFYIQALLYDINFTETIKDENLRQDLENYAKEFGNEALHKKLRQVDPESAQLIPANNVKRVIRAIEYYTQTGTKISTHNELEKNKKSPYNFAYFVINDNRQVLYDRINNRVDQMIETGLSKEIDFLLNEGYTRTLQSMQGIGYKEYLEYLNNECSESEAIEKIKQNSRHYAKRQLTWFRREKEVIWLDKTILNTDAKMFEEVLKDLKMKGII